MNSQDYLYEQQTAHTSKFAESAKEIKNLDRSIWSQLITVQATVLGISVSLLSYQQIRPGFWLLATWLLEILSIGTGFIVMILDAKQTFRASLYSYMMSMDLTDIQLKDSEGFFRTDREKKMGMTVAAFLKNPSMQGANVFTEHAKKLAEKYKMELESSKLFSDLPPTWKNKLSDLLLKHYSKASDLFYFTFVLSFLTLLISLLLKKTV